MSSAVVAERQRFRVASYLADLVRRSQPNDPVSVEPVDIPPFAPTSAFVIGDEVIECEVES